MNNLTDKELDELMERAAERGAEKAVRRLTSQIYQDVGKTVVRRFLEGVGMLVVALIGYAVHKGWL